MLEQKGGKRDSKEMHRPKIPNEKNQIEERINVIFSRNFYFIESSTKLTLKVEKKVIEPESQEFSLEYFLKVKICESPKIIVYVQVQKCQYIV